MFDPVPSLLAREVVKDHYLGKIPMKKGVQVSLKIITNQHKPEFYENPL
jgi:cytochrome P450